MKKILLCIALVAGTLPEAHAQGHAIRFILGEMDKVYTQPGLDIYCMGLGFDRSFNEHLTVGGDVCYDVTSGNSDAGSGKAVHVEEGNIQADYTVSKHLISLNYHTEYALWDNEGTHLYIGSFIGFRHLWQQWYGNGYYSGDNFYEGHTWVKVSKWIFPIGLRAGLRGPVDSRFLDLYGAVGYNIGGGARLFNKIPASADADYAETSGLAVTIGLAYGIGW